MIGGIENTVRLLASEISRRPGFEISVLTTNTGPWSERLQIDGVDVIKTGRQAIAASTPISLQLVWQMRQLRPDITHLHFPYPWGELAYLLAGHGKMILTYYSDIVKQRGLLRLYEPFLWRVLNRASVLVANSPNYLETSPYLKRFADKCVIIPCGVDLDRFNRVDENRVGEIRRRWRGPLVLFVGVFRYYKGLHYLIEAMEQVPATLLLVGAGPLEGELRRLVSDRGVQDKVFFVGAVPDEDLPSYYQASDVYVLPASHRSEALSIALMEAMSCGVPLVSTELGTGTSYVNADGETGLIVPPCDATALAGAINRLLGDEAMRRTMGQAGRCRAKAMFSQEVVVDQVAKLYERVYSGGV